MNKFWFEDHINTHSEVPCHYVRWTEVLFLPADLQPSNKKAEDRWWGLVGEVWTEWSFLLLNGIQFLRCENRVSILAEKTKHLDIRVANTASAPGISPEPSKHLQHQMILEELGVHFWLGWDCSEGPARPASPGWGTSSVQYVLVSHY